MSIKTLSCAAVSILFAAVSAQAGGVAKPIEPPAIVIPEQPKDRFSGVYVGANLGYVYDGREVAGVREQIRTNVVGTFEFDGFTLGARIGNRWLIGATYMGLELNARLTTVGAEVSSPPASGYADLEYTADLRATLGRMVNPSTMTYIFAGGGYGVFDYALSNGANLHAHDDALSLDSYVGGFGLEHAIDSKWSVLGEFEFATYQEKFVSNPAGINVTKATPQTYGLSLGMNYNF